MTTTTEALMALADEYAIQLGGIGDHGRGGKARAARAAIASAIAALEQECEQLRKDAERYRHLCEVHGPRAELCYQGHSYHGKAEFDAAIDAALAARSAEQKGV